MDEIVSVDVVVVWVRMYWLLSPALKRKGNNEINGFIDMSREGEEEEEREKQQQTIEI